MGTSILTKHDIAVLEKIKDPEAAASTPLLISDSLPRDSHIIDDTLYQHVTQRERDIIISIQTLELSIAGLRSTPLEHLEFTPLSLYRMCVKSLDKLIEEYPNYGSARNNRAQALRRIYGDEILLKTTGSMTQEPPPLDLAATNESRMAASYTILSDLSIAIGLLTPPNPFSSISRQAAKSLAQAYTQRGAVYHLTAKRLAANDTELSIDERLKEASWKAIDFEENASQDFMMGARYGNEIAKALAVSSNPTAKLCGEMVREAMRKEYACE